jgi:hypothetical protein
MSRSTALLSFALSCLPCACDRHPAASSDVPPVSVRQGPGVTNLQAASPAGTDSAFAGAIAPVVVDQLAGAWCDQQRSCDRVGAGGAYTSFFDCMEQTRTRGRRELESLRCVHGIHSARAQPCATAIRSEPCSGNPVVLLSPAKCSGAELCDE